MKLDFLLNEPNSPFLTLERSFWMGRTKLYLDNQEVLSQPKNSMTTSEHDLVYWIPMPDGSERQLTLKNRFYDPVPKAQVNGQELLLAKPVKPWEYIVACIPIALLFAGGAIGGGIGVAATYTNLNVMRSDSPTPLRIALCSVISVVALVVTVVVAGLVQAALSS